MREKINKGAVSTTLVACLFIVLAALGMVWSYPKIEENISLNKEYNFFNQEMFAEHYLIQSNYALYYEMMQDGKEKKLEPAAFFLENPTEMLSEYYEESTFNEVVEEWINALYTQNQNLEYYAKDRVSGKVKTNLKVGYSSQGEPVAPEVLKNNYQYFVAMIYDEHGNLSVEMLHGGNVAEGTQNIERSNTNIAYNYTSGKGSFEPIKNMEFLYAIPKGIQLNDNLAEHIWRLKNMGYQVVGSEVLIMALALCVLVALVFPYGSISRLRWFQKLQGLSIEVLSVGAVLMFMFSIFNAPTFIKECISNEMTWLFGSFIAGLHLKPPTIWILNGVFWMVTFGTTLLSVWIIKVMFHKGLIDYLREYSLIYRISSGIKKLNHKIAQKVSDTDLRHKDHRKVRKVILFNALVLGLFCCLWFFGIIGVVIYSIILYVLANRILGNISENYEKLMTMTTGMAQGNLEVDVTEHLGVFEPLRESLSEVQTGFKVAVDEAVKSQKMKTDLITNVSHDLKTPLTSIVSYVDLLKDENLSPEKRIRYIETLERKSARLQILIEDLFEMSKVSSGSIKLQQEQVDVVALLKQTLFELEDRLKMNKLTVRTQFPEEKVKLTLDSMRTYRVFDNLINNIAKYSLSGSRVYVEVVDEGEVVAVVLKNIAREELKFDPEEITERFVRGDQSRHTEGSGLGLAIAKSFVELQGGKLEISLDGDLFKVSIFFKK